MPQASPSFEGLMPASEASSRAKRMNRAVDTRHEHLVRSLLWWRGLKFRKNMKSLPGKPDIVFSKEKVVVFCDGDFWHGRHWAKLSRKLRIGTNGAYWFQKIRTNIQRDRRTNKCLEADNWRVVRIWETNFLNDPEGTTTLIEKIVRARRRMFKG
jgi:DNA mismatch endonuclease (patch repair protein)